MDQEVKNNKVWAKATGSQLLVETGSRSWWVFWIWPLGWPFVHSPWIWPGYDPLDMAPWIWPLGLGPLDMAPWTWTWPLGLRLGPLDFGLSPLDLIPWT